MNIEFKFRAWDGKKMHYNIIPWLWDFVIRLGWHRCEASADSDGEAKMLVKAIKFEQVMQFIGLKDKDGKEIYEGDVLHRPETSFFNWKVEYSKKNAGFVIVNIGIDGTRSEQLVICSEYFFENRIIIGNIYENPELLKHK